MTLSDAAVVALACDDDNEAFRALVERHGRAVFRLAHRMTGSRTDAEDIVQETFIRAYRQLSRFESRASFATWIHRIAVNCAIDLLRSRGGHHEAVYDDELPRICVQQELADGALVEIPIPELDMPRPTRMLFCDQRYLSDAARAFIEIVKRFSWSVTPQPRRARAKIALHPSVESRV